MGKCSLASLGERPLMTSDIRVGTGGSKIGRYRVGQGQKWQKT